MPEPVDSQPFGEWCVLELMGHRRLAGYVREVQLAGAGFLRLDIPAADDDPGRTQYIAPGSVYALHPVSQETARRAAGAWRPPPVQRWELPAAPAEARVCCPDGRFHPCQEHDPEGYATWAEEGMATAADPDPDYGRDLDDDDAEPGR